MNTKQLKAKVLDLAIHGKLLSPETVAELKKSPDYETADVLLEKIRKEKEEKIAKGELKRDKKDSYIFVGDDKRHYEKFADGTVKDIEDEIPFEVPEGWAWCRLGEICEVSSAKRVLQQDWKTSGIPFYRAREIAQLSNNETVKDDLFITFELYNELKQKYGVPIAGDLMVSAVGTIGKVYIVKDTDCFYYKDASVICFSKKEKSIDSLYLKLCCESDFLQEQMYSQSKGTTVDTITINKAQNYLIPLPPIFEQQKIVHSIQDFFGHIGILEQNKSELQFLINAAKSKILDLAIHGKLVPQDPNDEPAEELLKRIATSDNRPYEKVDEEIDYEIPKNWCLCKIKDVCSVIMGQSPAGEAVSDDKNGIEFHQGKICFGKKYLEESSSFTRHITKIAPKDSVLLCVRAPVGIVNITEREICIGRGLCAVIPKYEINSDFWFYWLQSLQSDFEQKATGTTFRAISVDVIKNQFVAIPPHEEQNRIVNKINELYEQLDKIVLNLV